MAGQPIENSLGHQLGLGFLGAAGHKPGDRRPVHLLDQERVCGRREDLFGLSVGELPWLERPELSLEGTIFEGASLVQQGQLGSLDPGTIER